MERFFQCLVLLAILSITASKPALRTCGGKAADVVFVLDASSSIWEPHFGKQLEFVSNLTEAFDVGPSAEQTRVGVLTFSDYSSIQFHLGDHTDTEEVTKAVKSVPYQTGRTNTSDALRTARMKMFAPNRSPREDIVRIAVVITDGMSENTKATYKEAMALKASGIQVFAVGIGFGIDEEELEVIASSPSDEFVFTVDDFEALDSIKNKLAIRTCEVTKLTTAPTSPATTTDRKPDTSAPTEETTTTKASKTPPETTTTISIQSTTSQSGILGDQPPYEDSTKVCQGKPAEVFFLLDSSSSILIEDFHKQSTFVQNVVSLFDIGSAKTRVGASTFSDSVFGVFDLRSFTSKPELLSAINKIPYLTGGTNTEEALRDMRTRGMAPEVIRQEVAHVGIVLTDGQSHDPKLTAEQARLAKEQGIYLFAIGIGDNVDMQELRDIASQPSKRFVFHVSNYDALESIKDVLAIRTCEVAPADEIKRTDACPEVPTDVMFVYDSGKMGTRNSAAISPVIDSVVSRLPMSERAFKFGLLANTCPPGDLRIPVTSDRTTLSMIADDREKQDLASLFRELRVNAFLPENGARRNARQVALVFLDGQLEDHDKIAREAKATKARGIEIYVVGIGSDVNTRDVTAIVSGPLSSHFIHMPSYEYLSSHSKDIENLFCPTYYLLDDLPVY